MNFVRQLLQASWTTVAIAAIAGIISGGCTVFLIALIATAMRQSQPPSLLEIGGFIGLCCIQLITRFISEVSLTRLGQEMTCRLQMLLSQRILASSLRQLETMGTPVLLASLTEDIQAISNFVTFIPFVCINIALVSGCLLYLIWLSGTLFLILLAFLGLGIVSFQFLQTKAIAQLRLARQHQDRLFQHFRAMTEGIKELKMHSDRRQAFLDEDLKLTAATVKKHKIAGMTIYIGAASWGQALQFLIMGILLFLMPSLQPSFRSVLSAYVLTFIYIGPYVGQILSVLPNWGKARIALLKISDLGLLLEKSAEPGVCSVSASGASWQKLELLGVTHTYFKERDDSNFTLGPIDLTLSAGKLVFIVGGNGSGKSTLAKLLTGLYIPEFGEIRLDGRAIDDANREWYRQHFAVVFSDFYLFERFLGLPQVDERVQEYLVKLQLDRKVKVEDGKLSTTNLSQGQRKRLALLTAYLEDRPIYLFDEWASDQDPIFKKTFYEELLPTLKAEGKTVLVISHDEKYFGVADQILRLDYGQVVSASDRLTNATKSSFSHL
ncbi:cyclic peptide export ABC transporter [Pseudanabaena sp. PCC 6802]|uniref:cyclic peptide export ABC transporter n=1 Tax=Pseudanabaena sp. PCC 6802 TaxID=118173 RepID=UPI000559E6E9|nr:cyclic peptide export ABC transporter [Pseudanabaena sp. PCC 6802]